MAESEQSGVLVFRGGVAALAYLTDVAPIDEIRVRLSILTWFLNVNIITRRSQSTLPFPFYRRLLAFTTSSYSTGHYRP